MKYSIKFDESSIFCSTSLFLSFCFDETLKLRLIFDSRWSSFSCIDEDRFLVFWHGSILTEILDFCKKESFSFWKKYLYFFRIPIFNFRGFSILMSFIMRNETFTCHKCGKDVTLHPTGSARNHCPYCLYSLHVDTESPGDRASDCHGLMDPI